MGGVSRAEMESGLMCAGLKKLILQAGEPSSGGFHHSIVGFFFPCSDRLLGCLASLTVSDLPAACLPPANILDTPPPSNISSMCASLVWGMSLEQVKMFDTVGMDLLDRLKQMLVYPTAKR